jgi:hypothetical protein
MELGCHWTDLRGGKNGTGGFTEICRRIPSFWQSWTKTMNTLHEDLHNTWSVTFHTVTSAPTFSFVTKFTGVAVVNMVNFVTIVTLVTNITIVAPG